jgi:formylglycine-generating enzyme required for sulfatase activity/tetratricopeptide (TPR) repeat protein
MSYSSADNRLTYTEYMLAHDFVEDIMSTTNAASKRLSMDISSQTRDVVASNEALTAHNIRATEIAAGQIRDAMNSGFGKLSSTAQNGFTRLSYDMQELSSGVSELNATFHWGFGQMLASMGHMNDTLAELIKIAKTPTQTAAYEQYEIARDAFRQGLFLECLESLDKAISGDHTSSGYKLEWRFHQMKGTLRLGFVNGDMTLVDLPAAEESFTLAARYAKTDFPDHAAHAYLSAGWAAYCQGQTKKGLAHTEQALAIMPDLGEALFQAAKVRMALGDVESALPLLDKAIDVDRLYMLKAAGDGDFQRHDEQLRGFLDAMRKEKYQQAVPRVRGALEKFRFWLENAPGAMNHTAIRKASEFISKGESWPLLDMLNVVQTLPELLDKMEEGAVAATFVRPTNAQVIAVSYEESTPAEENYQEEIVVKPGALFRRAITEMQTKTRTVMKRVKKSRTLQGIRLDFLDGMGVEKVAFDFCLIPSGSFAMGDKSNGPIHRVTISSDFYLGKYPVTQAQWHAIMGSNPSKFIGADLPVEQVSWEDCQEFIMRLNATTKDSYRLPTEAEWEYACRAGSTGKYCFGDSEALLGDYAWYSANSDSQTHPVGKKKPNCWGLHDMHGNVWEWCNDWYGDYTAAALTDPCGAATGIDRVPRGGGWYDEAADATSAGRGGGVPDGRFTHLGFRLVSLAVHRVLDVAQLAGECSPPPGRSITPGDDSPPSRWF